MPLPVAVYSSSQVRDIDARAVAAGTPGYTLMKRAGEGALRSLRSRWPMAMRVAIVCGAGNNGGDGYVLARFARAAGLQVVLLAAAPRERLRGDAQRACEEALASGCDVQPFSAHALADVDVIVDAVLGIGFRAPMRAELCEAITAINAARRPVFALDVPSGLDADDGHADIAVRADVTLTFVGLKTGLYAGRGPELAGLVLCDELELAPAEDTEPRMLRLTEASLEIALPRRRREAHKGDFGRVLIVGGGRGMPGAVHLAAEAALRVGAGLVTVASLPEHLTVIVGRRPEVMFVALPDAQALREPLKRADVVVIGPGLGREPWARALLDATLAQRREGQWLVLDADALNLLAESRATATRADWILTPHPGEAARLLDTGTADIQRDRLGALERLVERYGAHVVLKGAGSLVGAPGAVPRVCERGNPGMAIPGMGDVLSGTIAGVLAQCRDPSLAVGAAVFAHASAGDALARGGGERGILASEVARELRLWVNR